MRAYDVGLNVQGAPNYILPCSRFNSWGNAVVLRVVMGQMTDYYKPTPGNSLCGQQRAGPALPNRFLSLVKGAESISVAPARPTAQPW